MHSLNRNDLKAIFQKMIEQDNRISNAKYDPRLDANTIKGQKAWSSGQIDGIYFVMHRIAEQLRLPAKGDDGETIEEYYMRWLSTEQEEPKCQ